MARVIKEHDTASIKTTKVPPIIKEVERDLHFPNPHLEGPMLPADIRELGYKIRFIDEVFGGYKINVLREDGTSLARGVNIRRFWLEKSVDDELYGNILAIKLSFNTPYAVRITVYGDGEISKEKILKAIDNLSCNDKIEIMGAALLLGNSVSRNFDIRCAVAPLARCLKDESRGVRVNAAWTLGEFAKKGGEINEAETALLQACTHRHESTRRSAARALMHHYINEKDEKKMVMMMSHPDQVVRSTVEGVMERRSA